MRSEVFSGQLTVIIKANQPFSSSFEPLSTFHSGNDFFF